MNYLSLTVQNYHTHKRKKKEKHQRQMSVREKLINGGIQGGGGGGVRLEKNRKINKRWGDIYLAHQSIYN